MGFDISKIELGRDVRLNILFYGLMDAGKTTLLGSAEECEFTYPMFLMDVEGGTQSLAGSNIEITRPGSFAEIQEIYDFLRYDKHGFKSVGIDSVTEVQRKLSMGEIIGTLSEENDYSNLADATPPRQYDWLSSGEQMRRFIRAFRELAYLKKKSRRLHVMFGALEKSDDDRMIVCPSLPGQLGLEVGASVDIMGRLSVEEVLVGEDEELKERRLLSMKDTVGEDGFKYLGRARVPKGSKFPKEVWSPTVDKVVKLWMSRAAPARKGGKTRK